MFVTPELSASGVDAGVERLDLGDDGEVLEATDGATFGVVTRTLAVGVWTRVEVGVVPGVGNACLITAVNEDGFEGAECGELGADGLERFAFQLGESIVKLCECVEAHVRLDD